MFFSRVIPKFASLTEGCTFILSTDGGLGCVLMVYGLNPEKMNCDRLFNLFCLYGNVIKVMTALLDS